MIENLDVRDRFVEGFEKYSDHRIITFDMILITEMKTVHKCTYHYIKADVIGINSFMMRIKWKEELQNKNIEEVWYTFSSILNKCRNKYVPTKAGRRKKTP